MKEKIDKLTAHEKSARELGNTAEANAFKKKIAQLKRRKSSSPADPPGNAAGGGRRGQRRQRRWICSCGYELVLADDASAGAQVMIDIMLSSHRRDGHQLTLAD